MRIITSLLLICITFTSLAQRVSFEDPDLTFSFKKPKNWVIFDDGYVIKVSPSAKDSADTYLIITYFENAQPFGLFPSAQPVNQADRSDFQKTKIDGEIAHHVEQVNENSYQSLYSFRKYGQRFEIKTASLSEKDSRIFKKIIRSIRITQ